MESKTLVLNYKKEIKLAKYAGFCYGVKRAVDLSIKIKEENPKTSVYILGQLIHNNQVIEQLSALGIKTINDIPEELDGTCIIRTHGATPETFEVLKNKCCNVVDATCPDVKRVQDKAMMLVNEGYRVVIIGKADHPEVIGIKAHAELGAKEEPIVVSSAKEAEEYKNEFIKSPKIGIVIQTTQKHENFKTILPVIAQYAKELKIFNTICSATFKRQQEAKSLAKNVELMVVVGSKSSANTSHLAEILSQIVQTIHIETKEDLTEFNEIIKKANKIGVTAGASTPKYVIDEIIQEIGE